MLLLWLIIVVIVVFVLFMLVYMAIRCFIIAARNIDVLLLLFFVAHFPTVSLVICNYCCF